uniref:Uncharacterized protein n=1 Tax=Meloidogyne javanica TaxID=6303 RepID=A0A915MV67_MELJA
DENNNIQNQLQALDMSKSSSIISISDYISDNETSIKEKLPWHLEDISSTELTEDEERLLPMTGEEKEKRKEKKRRLKGEEKQRQMLEEKKKEEEKQLRILEAKKRGEVVGSKLPNKKGIMKRKREEDKEEEEAPDWETIAKTRRVRSKYEEDMLIKHKEIWNDILKRGDELQAKIQSRMDKELKTLKKELERKYKVKNEKEENNFKKFAKNVIGRAEKDKEEDIIPENLPKEKEEYLKEKKNEEEKREKEVGRSRQHNSEVDGNAFNRGRSRQRYTTFEDRVGRNAIRKRDYSMSPMRKPHAVDEKEKREKIQEKKAETQKNKEIGVNTIITGALWARIIDNLLETKDLLEIAPLPPSK